MTSNTRILGSLRSADGKGVVRMEDRFDTDINDLWSALTDPRRLARWIGDVEGDLHLGGEFHFRFFASGSEGTGRVEACEPPRRLLLTVVTVLLEPREDSQTLLTIRHTLLPAGLAGQHERGWEAVAGQLAANLPGAATAAPASPPAAPASS